MTRLAALLLLLATGLASYPACGQTGRTARITYEHRIMKERVRTPFAVLVREGIAQTDYHQKAQKVEEGNITFKAGEVRYVNHYHLQRRHFTEQRYFEGHQLVSDWPQDFEWKITDETKTIAGYRARKAITDSYELPKSHSLYDGKVYAWFTTDIPIAAGPGRYAGLPGLILEIQYERGTESYIFKKIEYDVEEPLRNITEGMRVSSEALLRPYDSNLEQRLKKVGKGK